MIGTISVKVQAQRPNFPLDPVFTFKGSRQFIVVENVPAAAGTWKLTEVSVKIILPDGSETSYAACENGDEWHVEVPATDAVGKTRDGFTVVGRDKDGNEYVLGKGDFYVLDSDGVVQPGEQKWTMRLVQAKGEKPVKGDVFLEQDGKLWVYDGAAWINAGGGGGASEEYVNTKVQEEAAARENADDEIRKSIPAKTSQLTNDSGFLTKTDTIDHAVSADTATAAIAANTATTANTAKNVPWSGVTDKPDLALKSEIPSKTSELTNDSGFLTEHQSLSGYYTKTETDANVQEEATARENADDEIRKSIPAKTSQLTNDSGFLTKTDTIDHAVSADTATTAIAANTANSVQWNGVQGKPVASATELGLVKVGANLTIDADGKLNASGGGGSGGGIQPSDVTWTIGNAFKLYDYNFNKKYQISADNVVNFIDFTCGNDRKPVAVLNEDQKAQVNLSVNLNDYFIQNPVKGYLQVVDQRTKPEGSQLSWLSVHFWAPGNNESDVRVDSSIQTIKIPDNAQSFRIDTYDNNINYIVKQYQLTGNIQQTIYTTKNNGPAPTEPLNNIDTYYAVNVFDSDSGSGSSSVNFTICYNQRGGSDEIQIYLQDKNGYGGYLNLPFNNNPNSNGWTTLNFKDIEIFSYESYSRPMQLFKNNNSGVSIDESYTTGSSYSLDSNYNYTLYIWGNGN